MSGLKTVFVVAADAGIGKAEKIVDATRIKKMVMQKILLLIFLFTVIPLVF
jgi:hypothetical protein